MINLTDEQKKAVIREYRKVYMSEWREKNREKHNAYMRDYRKKRRVEAEVITDERN